MRPSGLDQDQLRTIVERLPAIIWVTDASHHLNFFNRAAGEFFIDDPLMALGLPWLDIVHESDRERMSEIISSRMDQWSKWTTMFRAKGRDSLWCWMETCIQPLFNDRGKFNGLFYMARDLGGIGEHGIPPESMSWKAPPPVAGLEAELRTAIKEGTLALYFQPKIEMPNFQLVGFEALIRWPHPSHGLLYPVSFVQLAEDSQLIGPLTKWVFEETARQTRSWIDAGFIPLPIAVNVTPGEFLTAVLNEHLPAYFAFDLPRGLLELEITEGTMLADLAQASAVVTSLNTLGVTVAIDDFGTGYSSLARLNNLPISTLKIDRVLIKDVHWNRTSRAVTAGIISIAHELGIHVIAEGVENHAQLRALNSMDCHVVQGYLTGRPLPGDEAMSMLTPTTS